MDTTQEFVALDENEELPEDMFRRRVDSCPVLVRVDSQAGTSSMTASTINLFKGIVGAGILALPGGVAAFTDSPSGLLPGLVIAGVLAVLSAYCFWIIGRLCLLTRSSSYADLMVHVYGSRVRWPVQMLLLAKTTTALLIYSIIIGDTSRDLSKMLHVSGMFSNRSVLLAAISAFVLLPLSLRRSLAALAPFAALGSVGTIYTALFMGLRYFQGAYEPGGELYSEAPFKPNFGEGSSRVLPMFKLISMLATAYIAHFNAPKFANQLAVASDERFAVVSSSAFLAAYLVMGLVTSFGFLTFGGACQGLVLNNYALTDVYATVARGATLLSVISGYPFIMVACRDGCADCVSRFLCRSAEERPQPWVKKLITVLLVVAMSGVATVVDDLGIVVEIVGALLATSLIYILPSLAFLGTFGPAVRSGTANRAQRLECLLNYGMLVMGMVLAVVGVVVAVVGK